MTNDEKKKEDSPEDRTPWYGRPMDERKPPEGEIVEHVVISEDDVGVIEVDEKGEARVPGQDPPKPDAQPEPAVDPLSAVEPTEMVHVTRVIDVIGTAEEVKKALDQSFLQAGVGVTTGNLTTMIERERHYLKGGDYIVTMIKNTAKDG